MNCDRNGEQCDYSIKLNWLGRNKKGGSPGDNMLGTGSFGIPYDPHASRKSSKSTDDQPSPSPSRLSFYGPTQNAQDYSSPSGDLRRSREIEVQASTQYVHNGDTQMLELPAVRDLSGAPFQQLRASSLGSYPSPANSTSDSPPKLPLPSFRYNQGSQSQSTSNPEMRPPYQTSQNNFSNTSDTADSPKDPAYMMDQRSKRMRFSTNGDGYDFNQSSHNLPSHNFSPTSNFGPTNRPPPVTHPTSFGGAYTPATSAGSDDTNRPALKRFPYPSTDTPHDRRVSVQSLLSEVSPVDSGSEAQFPERLSTASSVTSEKTPYGIDRGLPDKDVTDNDDTNALSDRTPTLSTLAPVDAESDAGGDDCYSEFGFGLDAHNDISEETSYYSKPIRVCISRSLEPLPAELKDNPMNLLYFHHFLDHTARILVPHDCSENPFKSILPRSWSPISPFFFQLVLMQRTVAIEDPVLLHLLLSYSACHRSRLLNHPEPMKRISKWMEGVFPALASALSPGNQVSDSNLATAIMLASLEIIAPKSFEVEVPWQQHLNFAREMIMRRGHGKPVHRRETIPYFLTRWFAYLDVFGSLSGRKNDQPLFHGNYWASDSTDDESGFQIDCLLGFTSWCVSILAKIAELARACDSERIDPEGTVRTDWKPTPETAEKAESLKSNLERARMHPYHGCPHRRSSTNTKDNESYAVEMVTTNDAFHWAGLIHLHRRVLGKRSEDPEVQMYVREIVTALYKIRKGGTAEACLLFPMFTAGCDAREQSQRDTIMDRLKGMEGSGMFQVRQARALMEKVWETGRSWETFSGEFIG